MKANWDCKHCNTVQAAVMPSRETLPKKKYWDKHMECVCCKAQCFVIIYPDGRTGSTVVEHPEPINPDSV